MLAHLSQQLQRLANSRNILLFLALYLVFVVGVLPVAGAQLAALSDGIGPLDQQFTYSPTAAYAALAAYGPSGRELYLLLELTVNAVYSVVYAIFFSLTISYCLQRAAPEGHPVQRLNLLPFAALAADWLESAALSLLLLFYPDELPVVATLASGLTSLKWMLAVLSLLAVLGGLAAVVRQRLQAARPA